MLILNGLYGRPFSGKIPLSPPLRHLRMIFKDRRLFELGNSVNGRWPIADFLNGGEFVQGRSAEL
jgi:hypothetical protein